MSKNSNYEKLIIIACFMCNMAQIPSWYDNKIIELAYMGCWVLLAVLLLSRQGLQDIHYISLILFFDIFCFGMHFLGGDYISSTMFRSINLSCFIFLIGTGAGMYLDGESIRKIALSFIMSSLIVATTIYLSVFRGANWSGTSAYLYGAKNSAGQIFLTAVVFIAVFFYREHKTISTLAIIFLVMLIAMMKSRATIITLVIILLYYTIFLARSSEVRFFLVVMIAVASIYIWTDPELHNLVINQIMLNNKGASDFSAVTSKRDVQYEYFLLNYRYHWLIGDGKTYLESMPLVALMRYGLIGGIPLILFSLKPISIGIKFIKDDQYKILSTIVVLLGLMMWFNGIFEEQSPFGPGGKCYMLWLMTGILIGQIKRYEIYGDYLELSH